MEEIWHPIPGWEGLYEITKSGRVRSLDRVVITKSGVSRRISGRELKTNHPNGRYPMADLRGAGRRENSLLHRLLAITFIPNPDNLPYVRHLNDDPLDYRLENLCWGTQYDNLHDLYATRGHYNTHKTHCKYGHEFTEENTYHRPGGGRTCRLCRVNHIRNYRQKKRGQS